MLNPMALSGRTILVTGASSGIGREVAIVLSQLEARLILVARNQERLSTTLALLDGNEHTVIPFDLLEVDSISQWMKKLAGELGPFDGVVHSAGIHQMQPLRFLTNDQLNEVMNINFNAAVALVRGLRQKNVSAKQASVVFLSSVMGLVGQPGVAAYTASKGALLAVTKSLALELAKENIRVNSIAAGQVETEMTERQRQTLTLEQFANIETMHPLGIGTARDIANAVAFLLADSGRWITGTTLIVDGGYTAH